MSADTNYRVVEAAPIRRQMALPSLALLVVVFLLIVAALVLHQYWQQLSTLIFLLLVVILGCLGVACIAGTLGLLGWLRRKARLPLTAVYTQKAGDEIVATQAVGQEVIWRPQGLWPNLQSASLHVDIARPAALSAPETPGALTEAPALRSVAYSEVARQIAPGQMLLGVRPDGSLRLGTMDDLLSCLMLGKSGSGKSVTIAAKVTEAVRNGASLIICDPHGHKPDSLIRKIAPLEEALFPGARMAIDHASIAAMIHLARVELERRIAGAGYEQALVVIIEEYNRLFDDASLQDDLVALSRALAGEGRGFAVYGYFGAQGMSGASFARVRKLCASYIIHRVEYGDAHTILHDSALAEHAMRLSPGATIVVDTDGERELLQQPHITRGDVEAVAAQLPRRPWSLIGMPPLPMKSTLQDSLPQMPTQNAPVDLYGEKRREEKRRLRVTPIERQEILAWHQRGFAASAIASKMGKSSNFYYVIRDVLEEEELAGHSAQEQE